MEKWIDFYEPFFPTQKEAAEFVGACEVKTRANEIAMLLMHQTQRLVSLADDIVKVRPRDSLRLLFLLICAENVVKLHDGLTKRKADSKAFTRKFFTEFVSAQDKRRLEAGFLTDRHLSLQKVVDLLYGIRCDVVHEGRYWDFFFSTDGFSVSTLGRDLSVRIRYETLREIIVRAAIVAIQQKLQRTPPKTPLKLPVGRRRPPAT